MGKINSKEGRVNFLKIKNANQKEAKYMSFLRSLIREGAPKISPEKVLEVLKKDSKVKFIDVRTRHEFEQMNIPQSINIPIDEIMGIEDRIADKDGIIIIYSQNGGRSAKAGSIMLSKGYKNVRDLGGIENWPYKVNGK